MSTAQPTRRLESQADTENSKITDRYLLWMLGQILAPYKWQLALVFALLVAVTIVSMLQPYLVQRAVDGPITNGDISGLVPYGIVYFVAIIVIFALR